MRLFNLLIVFALALLLTTDASAAQKGNGKKKSHPVRGVVVAVEKDTITVQVRRGKKKGGGTTHRKFQLNSSTQYESLKVIRVKGQKPQKEAKAATFTDVQSGQHVLIVPQGEMATKVSILERHKGKGKKKPA
jgi:hypothetical protein